VSPKEDLLQEVIQSDGVNDAESPVDSEVAEDPNLVLDADIQAAEDPGLQADQSQSIEDAPISDAHISDDGEVDAGCVPSCALAMCGEDSCGGSCGTCNEDEECTEEGSCAPVFDGVCPPGSETVGSEVGDTMGEVVLSDCEGNLHSIHQLCPRKASWIYIYAGWCGPCQEHMNWAEFWYQGYGEYDFNAYVVITDGPNFETVTPAYCQQVRANFGLTMTVLMDPQEKVSALAGTDGSDVNIVLGQGSVIRYVGSNPLEFKEALDQELELED
jgi:hypothetical protein